MMTHGSHTVADMINPKSEPSAALSRGSSSPSSSHNSAKMGSRRIFTPQFKLQVLDSYRNDGDCKGNQRATARKYGIHRRQIQKWLQVENNLRSVVANGGGGAASASSTSTSAASAAHSNAIASMAGASMKINLLNHRHPHQLHPVHHVHLPQAHHLQYQPMHHPLHQGLTSLMQAPMAAAAAAAAAAGISGMPGHYHHHHLHQQPHPLAFHPIVPSQQHANSIELKMAGPDSARQRVARSGASACLLSPVLTHTNGGVVAPTAIPVSSCSPLSVTSSSSMSSSASLSSQQPQLLQLNDLAPSNGDSAQQKQRSVIYSPVPVLAPSDGSYYGHIHAVATQNVSSASTSTHRYDHPIDLSRPGVHGMLSPTPQCPRTRGHNQEKPVTTVSYHEQEEEEIRVEEVDESQQAWDLSCRRAIKRSCSAMSGPVAAPEPSRPAKSVKLFKPYLLDEDKNDEEDVKRRRDSALVDDDKDSASEVPVIADAGSPSPSSQHQYPIIWSNSAPGRMCFDQHTMVLEVGPLAQQIVLPPPQTSTIVSPSSEWHSPQASPVSGYDSSTSISSVCSGPEEDSISHSSCSIGSNRDKLKQQTIDSFYHDVTCRGDYRAVANKYNISRKYVEKWLQQEQEHHHAAAGALTSVRTPVIVG